jgi:hypothetical protein
MVEVRPNKIKGNKMEPTSNQVERTEQDWKQIAGEEIKYFYMPGTHYAAGSELACLRLLNKYRWSISTKEELYWPRVEYSKNLDSWVFMLPICA